MKVLLIEDHQLLCQVVVLCLKRHYPDAAFEVAESIQAAKVRLRSPWDIVLLDLLLPDGSGFDLLSYIKRFFVETKVIVLTGTAEQDYGLAALYEGADAFVTKQASMTDLVRAIDCALVGRRYFSPSMAERVLDAHTHSRNRNDSLSSRELDILHFVGQGFSAPRIAQALNLSSRTVETYRSRIYRKLALSSKADLIRYAVARELNTAVNQRSAE
jgi:two-component system invasion response regulator UvrY